MKARLAAVVALAVVSLLPGIGVAEAAPLPPLKIRSGDVTMCLTPAAQAGFAANDLRLDAIAPSTYSTSTDGRSCVTFPVEGEADLTLTNAHANFLGGLDFVHAGAHHLRVTDLVARIRGTYVVGTARLDNRPEDIEVLTADLRQAHITPTLLPLGLHGSATAVLTENLANALRTAFGATPLDSGAVLFDATGQVELGPSILGLPAEHATR